MFQKIFYLFFVHNIRTIMAECWIRHKNDNYFLPPRFNDPKRIFCKVGLEVCCPDGCCNSPQYNTIYPYIWEIIITAILIFMSLLVGVCVFYYCKYSLRTNVLSVDQRMDPRVVRSQHRVSPPPPYNVAVLLPQVSSNETNERVPTYEEAISKERF